MMVGTLMAPHLLPHLTLFTVLFVIAFAQVRLTLSTILERGGRTRWDTYESIRSADGSRSQRSTMLRPSSPAAPMIEQIARALATADVPSSPHAGLVRGEEVNVALKG
jgi:hypothetical protein